MMALRTAAGRSWRAIGLARQPGGGRRSRVRAQPGDQQPDHNKEDLVWAQLAFPFYMQSSQHNPEVCNDFDKAVAEAEAGGRLSGDAGARCVWQTIRSEAERDAAEEPLLSSFLYASILAHDSFERALAFVLSNRLASAVMLPTQLFEIFHEVLTSDAEVREGALADVEACRERDPACRSYSQALLYYKGYHALQTHRIAHALWTRGQRVMAMALQSRVSEVLAVDIHPAARLGRGILLDHGTGVVIGETAVVGNNVSLLQNVTLGGTGKEVGDRHPKISDNVLIGASATVLGNIVVGRGAQIAAGSLVLKPVPPHTMVAGSPAKPVGKLFGNPALDMQQWSRKFSDEDSLCEPGPGTSLGSRPSSSTTGSSTSDGGSSNGATLEPASHSSISGSGPSSSSSGEPSPVVVAGLGSSSGGSGAGASSSSGSHAPAFEGAAASNGVASSSGQAAQHDSVHSVLANGNGHAPAPHARTPVSLHSHDAGAARDGPAPLRGVYEGAVDATMDDEAAAILWPHREEDLDPEYVI